MTATTWTPPDDLNPSEILHSAVADTRSGIHEVALAKFLWFHHNALRYEQAFGGVRLSYALSSWLDLAKSYPPAREAFINTRDDTEAAFRADMSDFDLFHDATSLNRELGEASRTADLFGEVAACDHLALRRKGRRELCGA